MSKEITAQLRRAISQSKLSRYSICDQAGIEQASMSRFMSSKVGLSLASANAICKVLGLELVGRKTGKGKGDRK